MRHLPIACLSLLLCACSGGGGPAATPAPTPVPSPTPSPAPTPAPGTPDVSWSRWSPTVVPEDQASPVLFEAALAGVSGDVVLETLSGDFALRDDGREGDAVAGDGIWSVRLSPAVVLRQYSAKWVQHPPVGQLRLGSSALRFNVFAEIWSPAIGLVPVRKLAEDMQETDYVVNLAVSPGTLRDSDVRPLARRFYASYPDQYDFLNVVLIAGPRGNRSHSIIKNTTKGIGFGMMDESASFGSAGRLQGWSRFPLSAGFDGGGKAVLHETGHQWIQYMDSPELAQARPHYPAGSLAANVMGFSLPPGNQGGEYLYAFTRAAGGWQVGTADPLQGTRFNTMELYMMGLLSAAEVGEFFALKNPTQALQPGDFLPDAAVTPVRINDLVARYGARDPAVGKAQTAFRMATLIVSEQLLDQRALSLYDWLARRAEAREVQDCADGFAAGRCLPWFAATGGRSTLSARLR
ncbi:choice-of-anchor X domain-containing protein [Massilia sp. TS11]|uniref:choice-of-anchor X domain-containing protein n=1 Tax=Massilia sp. TS11 TaxID=2908003 RepID=UPI001EDA7474|nr:choice-of-anchor X domain-containing protein [Massilia sp. TS11]MCG2584850.1 hypothetical protein [Massilia sp. TS11]